MFETLNIRLIYRIKLNTRYLFTWQADGERVRNTKKAKFVTNTPSHWQKCIFIQECQMPITILKKKRKKYSKNYPYLHCCLWYLPQHQVYLSLSHQAAFATVFEKWEITHKMYMVKQHNYWINISNNNDSVKELYLVYLYEFHYMHLVRSNQQKTKT